MFEVLAHRKNTIQESEEWLNHSCASLEDFTCQPPQIRARSRKSRAHQKAMGSATLVRVVRNSYAVIPPMNIGNHMTISKSLLLRRAWHQ